jgi:hypothetical protein
MKTLFTLAFMLQGSDWKVYSVEKMEHGIYNVVVKKKQPGGTLFRAYYTDKIQPPKTF